MKNLKSSYVLEIKKIIYNLIQKNYTDPSIVFRGSKPEEIQEVIEDYEDAVNAKITVPPESYFYGDLYTIDWEDDGEIITLVNFYLWFDGEISDLCVDICIKEKDGNIFSYLDDIKVP